MLRRIALLILACGAVAPCQAATVLPAQVDRCAAPPQIDRITRPYREAGQNLQYLIAMVPDPIDSHVPRTYDLLLTSIVQAFELDGYQRRDSWLPWAGDGTKPTGDPSPIRDSRRGEPNPGVMIFQRDDSVFAVLLVGESPVRGVRPGVLNQALSIADACTAPGKPLDILGPTFSGSTDSLGLTLQERLPAQPAEKNGEEVCPSDGVLPRRCVRIISGSATNPAVNRLNQLAGVTYEAQSTDDSMKMEHLLAYLDRLGIERVALLVESSSYGQGFTQDSPQNKVKLILPFPMHISSIRSAYARDRKETEGQQTANAAGLGNGDSRLEIDLEEQGNAQTGLNLFDPRLTPPTYDLVLSRILQTLVRRRVEAVGIVATNIKDKLFLADEISRHAPNLRLFTFEGDELLTHPEYARATRGMLVVSSHSLELEWRSAAAEGATPALITRFGDDASQGVFEAVVRIIRRTGAPAADSVPLSSSMACHLRDRAETGGRTVWISVVGREGLYPVRIVRGFETFQPGIDPARSGLMLAPRGWILLWLLLTLVLVCLAIWTANLRSPLKGAATDGYFRRFKASLSNVCFYTRTEETRDHEALSLALLGLVGLAYTVSGAPVLARLADRLTPSLMQFFKDQSLAGLSDWMWCLLAAGALSSPPTAALLLLTRDGARLRGGRVAQYLKLGFGFAVFYAFIGWIAFGRSERSLDLDSGVSPTLPVLLLLGVPVLWVATGILRCRTFQEKMSPLVGSDARLKELSAVRRRLRPTWARLRRKDFALLAAALLGLPVFYLLFYFDGLWPLRLLHSVETGWLFDFGIGFLLVVAIGLVLEASFRYFRAWRKLRRTARLWVATQMPGEALPECGDSESPPQEPSANGIDLRESAAEVLNCLLGQIRWLMLFSTVGLILILVALLTYPFEPDQVLALYMSLLIVACGATVAAVNWQIGQDDALNRIRNQDGGWLTFHRFGRGLVYVGVPAAGLVASRFPGTLDQLLAWLEPIFNVFA